jgi:hypothetical protein
VVSLGGVGLVTAGGGGGGATPAGDGLVLASLVVSAALTVAQGRLLAGRDPVAVTAVQFLGAALGALPVAALTEGAPAVPGGAGPVLAAAALAVGGTLLPFTLFAFVQSRVSAEVAGAFFNLEPLVGAITGAVAFGDPAGLAQVAGGAAILAGIALSSLPLLALRPRAITPPSVPAPAAERAAPAGRALAVAVQRRQVVDGERPLTVAAGLAALAEPGLAVAGPAGRPLAEVAACAGATVVRLQRLRPGPPPLADTAVLADAAVPAGIAVLADHAPRADIAPMQKARARAA